MRFFITFMLLMLPLSAMAGDISATFDNQDGSTFTISARDMQHIRMDAAPDAYTLMRGKKVYMVSSNGEGGWNIMDMDQMAGFMGMAGTDDSSDDYVVTYKDTGRSERIAGYTGDVYDVVVKEKGKVISRDEIVLSNHGDIQRINKVWMALAARMSSIMNMNLAEIIEQSKNHGYGGMLRYGRDMTLRSLSKATLPSGYFELPGNAQKVNMGKAPKAPTQTEDSVVEQDAKEVGSVAHDEVKEATKDEVREGVRDIFNSIFD